MCLASALTSSCWVLQVLHVRTTLRCRRSPRALHSLPFALHVLGFIVLRMLSICFNVLRARLSASNGHDDDGHDLADDRRATLVMHRLLHLIFPCGDDSDAYYDFVCQREQSAPSPPNRKELRNSKSHGHAWRRPDNIAVAQKLSGQSHRQRKTGPRCTWLTSSIRWKDQLAMPQQADIPASDLAIR